MNYYLVKAKCGHVGRNRYYEGMFPIVERTAKAAAKKVREYGRVKRDHKDAILSVENISEKVYCYYLEEYEHQIYFKCNSRKEQKLHWEEIKPFVHEEIETTIKRLQKHNDFYKSKSKRKGIRNPYKYAKYNMYVA